MDYEKAYKEALERANSFQEKYGGDYAGHIFPELRESEDEDERIRKFLVDYFASYKIGNVTTKLNGVRIDDILNYLEKQKGQKIVYEDEYQRMVHKMPLEKAKYYASKYIH